VRLILMRHAPAASGADDTARPLTAEGRTHAAAAARGLARLEPDVERVLASPARRCRETAAAVAHAFDLAAVEVASEWALDGSPEAALERALADPRPTIAVGHAPDLSRVAESLLQGTPLHLDCGGAACLELDQHGRQALLVWSMPQRVLAAFGRAGA
jgi:phosphohistidine phosphatase